MKYRIVNGRIIDGSGEKSYTKDIAIHDGRIVLNPQAQSADEIVIDASGLCVSPGFIDTHRHADIAVFRDAEFGKIELSQGITTIVSGNCGLSVVPSSDASRQEMYSYIKPCLGKDEGFCFSSFAEYMDALDKKALPINIGMLVAAGAATVATKGFSGEPFNEKTLKTTIGLIDEALDAGAVGISSGLIYIPECFTDRKSLESILKRAKLKDRYVSFHLRTEGSGIIEALNEVIDLAKATGISVNLSHFKAIGKPNWGILISRAIELIDNARSAGIHITADFYPYNYLATMLMSLLPPNVAAKGKNALIDLFGTEKGIQEFLTEVKRPRDDWEDQSIYTGWDNIYLSSVVTKKNKDIESKSLREISKIRGIDNEWQTMAQLLHEENGEAGLIQVGMSEQDVEQVAGLDYTMLASDSLYSGADKPHPRLYGAFPKLIRHYVKERNIMTPERAIMKMTSLPASRLNIKDRGLIRENYCADICIFDYNTIADTATFQNPCSFSKGIKYVFVNGDLAWYDNDTTGKKSGKTIRA